MALVAPFSSAALRAIIAASLLMARWGTEKHCMASFVTYRLLFLPIVQTGSGKSFSMMGDRSSEASTGVIPRFARELFRQMSSDYDPAVCV